MQVGRFQRSSNLLQVLGPPEEGEMATEGRRTVLFEDHPAIYVSVRARVTGHFRRRLEERGGDPTRLALEGDRLEAHGWLQAVREGGFNLVVPGFGQVRLRADRYGGTFVAVTFLPSPAG